MANTECVTQQQSDRPTKLCDQLKIGNNHEMKKKNSRNAGNEILISSFRVHFIWSIDFVAAEVKIDFVLSLKTLEFDDYLILISTNYVIKKKYRKFA